jgi:hypothetical protein
MDVLVIEVRRHKVIGLDCIAAQTLRSVEHGTACRFLMRRSRVVVGYSHFSHFQSSFFDDGQGLVGVTALPGPAYLPWVNRARASRFLRRPLPAPAAPS